MNFVCSSIFSCTHPVSSTHTQLSIFNAQCRYTAKFLSFQASKASIPLFLYFWKILHHHDPVVNYGLQALLQNLARPYICCMPWGFSIAVFLVRSLVFLSHSIHPFRRFIGSVKSGISRDQVIQRSQGPVSVYSFFCIRCQHSVNNL